MTLDADGRPVLVEGGAPVDIVISRDGPTDQPLVVTLSSDDTTEATVPLTVTIPAGSSSVTVPVTPVDDSEVDGSQFPTITATAPGANPGSLEARVDDNERPTITIAPDPSVTLDADGRPVLVEGGAPVDIVISRDGPTDQPLVVTLSSDDTTEATVPLTVTIPAGSSSVTVPVTPVDDSEVDGSQFPTITATAPGANPGSLEARVDDNEDPATAVIRGRYFCDENDNDVDDNESGIANVLVLLIQNGQVVRLAATDGNGDYEFAGLEAGTYSVRFSADPAGKVFVAQDDPNGNGDDTNDSDVNQSTGETDPITVEIGEVVENVDAGVEEVDPMTSSIGDTVWLDTFGDGILNVGTDVGGNDPLFSGMEQGVEGVTVQLKLEDGTVLQEQQTDADGKYLFSGLAAGTYVIGFIAPEGFEFTVQDAGTDDTADSDADPTTGMTDPIVLGIDEQIDTVDAGLLRCGLIEGTSQADPNSPVGGYDLLVGCDSTDDTILGLSGSDTLIGRAGNDELFGSTFDDTLFGGDGEDILSGGTQNDVLEGGLGNDIIDGDEDFDTAIIAGNAADAAITVLDIFTGELEVVSADGTDILRNIELIQFDDQVIEVDSIVQGGSRDVVAAPAPGGSVNTDVLANDLQISEGTLEVVQVNNGAFGTVTLEADGTVTYAASDDFPGYDFYSYTVSNGIGFVRTVEVQVGEIPTIDPLAADIVVADTRGTDLNRIEGSDDPEQILGGAGFDRLDGNGGADIIDGGNGSDTLIGGNDADVLIGGDGDDRVQADRADDQLFGGVGRDNLLGGDQADIMFGGMGADEFRGQSGDDFMVGGTGDDTFTNLFDGTDTALGGAGNDTFFWSVEDDQGDLTDGLADFIDGESGIDTLIIDLGGLDPATAGLLEASIVADITAYEAGAALFPPAGSVNDGSTLTDTFAFTDLDLEIRNIENIILEGLLTA